MAKDEPLWLPEDQAPAEYTPAAQFREVGVIGGAPVQPVRPRQRRPRWLVPAVAGIVLVLIATVAGVWALSALTAVDPARAAYAYVPDDSQMVVELRLDLPAGQEAELGTLLSRFPGFGNAATAQRLLVERLDDLVRSATEGRASYEDDVQSFFSGWIVGVVPPQPTASMTIPMPLVVAGVYDRAAAETAILKLRPQDVEWTTTDVLGTQVLSGGGGSYAITDDALIVGGTAADVERALRTKAGELGSLLDRAEFGDAFERVPAGRLGMVWADIEASRTAPGLPTPPPDLSPACTGLIASAPREAIAVLYLRDGRAVVDVSYSRAAGGPVFEVGPSNLDDRTPANVFFYSEKQAVGPGAVDALACLRSYAELNEELAELEESLGQLEDLVDWMGDGAIAVRYDGAKLTGGLLVQVTDELKASETMGQLRAALTALGNEQGEVKVSEEIYSDARLVTFDFKSGGPSSLPDYVPATSLAYAVKDGLLVIGVDASFARAVLDTEPSTSLASNDSYRRMLEATGGGENAAVAFVDLPTALEVADAISGAEPGQGDGLGSIRAFLGPLANASVVVLADQAAVTVRISVTTREVR